MQQIPLEVQLKKQNTFQEFLAGENSQAVEALKKLCATPTHQLDENFLFIWGEPQSGRTHLLQACCHQINTLNGNATYLPGKHLHKLSPSMLENLERNQIICIDDISLLMQSKLWEEALFHLFNKVKEQSTRLVISSSCPPAQLNSALADLKSRLSWGLVFKLHRLDDESKLIALQQQAQLRGITLTRPAGEFLLSHIARDWNSLLQALDTLDHASLKHQRKLTIPFIKEILKII
jgi:DnaA-homolog protein